MEAIPENDQEDNHHDAAGAVRARSSDGRPLRPVHLDRRGSRTGAGVEGAIRTDWTFSAFDWQLATTFSLKIGGYPDLDLAVYGLGGVTLPLTSGIVYSQIYGDVATLDPLCWSAGLGVLFVLDDGWTLALEAMADISPDQEAGMPTFGGTIGVVPTYTIAPAREWLAVSLTLPITISASTTGASIGIGLGVSMDIDDHAINR